MQAPADPEIRLGRLAGSVHDAAHDRDLDVKRVLRDHLLHRVRKRDEVDVGPPAGRTRDHLDLALPKTQGL